MKAIIVLTLLVFMISVYPTDVDLVEGHVRRPVRHPTGPVIRGGFRRDLQWPRPPWERIIMLEAGRREKRRPIEITLALDVELEPSDLTEDCEIICDLEIERGSAEVCEACQRVCSRLCCRANQVPTKCVMRAAVPSNIDIVVTTSSRLPGATCMNDCVNAKRVCESIPSGCHGCPNCCQEINSALDGCRPNRS